MPEISRFFGIVIRMFFNEHNPPHFHVEYGSYKAVFSIRDLIFLEGELPKRVTNFVLEWAFEHRLELLDNWNNIRERKPFTKIRGLDE